MIAEAVGLGLVVSLLFSEAVGFAAGGFVVPGYIALHLGAPNMLLGTAIATAATYLSLRGLGSFLVIYGRRSLVLACLLGFSYGGLITRLPGLVQMPGTLAVIGHIVPGLIAYWMSRQGVARTVAATIVAAVLVRLMLIVVHGGALLDASSF